MRGRKTVSIGGVVILVVAASVFWLGRPSERAVATARLRALLETVENGDSDGVLNHVVAPPSMASDSAERQATRLIESLRGEISGHGLDILEEEGEFGPLEEIFPEEVTRWTSVWGVDPASCLAFKLEKGAFQAEVVLVRESKGAFKVLRCNDVKRLALENQSTGE